MIEFSIKKEKEEKMKPMVLTGKYGEASIYAKTIEEELITQCTTLLDQPMTKGIKIAIMPDTHVGKGCMIGTTMEIQDEVCPNLVGVDIGCGMLTVNLGRVDINYDKLDKVIDRYVPLGFNIHDKMTAEANEFFTIYQTKAPLKLDRPKRGIGTLGGGNHFIEVGEDRFTKEKYLVIHTGSRNFGKQIADYWQEVAIDKLTAGELIDTQAVVDQLKIEGRHSEIEETIKEIVKHNKEAMKDMRNQDLATLSGQDMEDYIHDTKIAQYYATANRFSIANTILQSYFNRRLHMFEFFETVHNYIDTHTMILRKGAISAHASEKVLIPLNMRDGSLIAVGKGNLDWNNSAPHGAGRLMSRSKARKQINMQDFTDSMKGIHSVSVNESTLDESPFAYKDAKEIIECIQDTVHVTQIIKPVYNRKA